MASDGVAGAASWETEATEASEKWVGRVKSVDRASGALLQVGAVEGRPMSTYFAVHDIHVIIANGEAG